jgi:hypothetical protein
MGNREDRLMKYLKSILVLSSMFLLMAMSSSSIPENSVKSDEHPGWKCKSGYVQKRNTCIDYEAPSNSTMNGDGNTWSCNIGYYKYRNTCKKNK